MTIDSACDDPTFFLENKSKPTLKRNHNCFYQIQGLMATCNVEWAELIVYTEKDIVSEQCYQQSNVTKTDILLLYIQSYTLN